MAAYQASDHIAGKGHRATMDALRPKPKVVEAPSHRRQQVPRTPVEALVAGSGKPGAYGMWECVLCHRAMTRGARIAHLSGAPHRRRVQGGKETLEKAAREKEKEEREVGKRRVVAEQKAAREKQKEQEREVAKRRVVAELAAALLREENLRAVEKARRDWAQHEAERERCEAERVRELERAARMQEQLENEAEEARQRERQRERDEQDRERIAQLVDRQRAVIREAEVKTDPQSEQKQCIKNVRKNNHPRVAVAGFMGAGSAIGSSGASPKSSEGERDAFQVRMCKFLQAQELLKQEHLNSAPVDKQPTNEYERTG